MNYDKLRKAGIGKRYLDTLPRMHGPGLEVAETITDQLEQSPLVFVTGDIGTGKTQSAIKVASEHTGSIQYFLEMEFINTFKRLRLGIEQEEALERINGVFDSDLLILDGLFKGLEEGRELIGKMISARCKKELKTILIVMNLSDIGWWIEEGQMFAVTYCDHSYRKRE